MTSESPQNPSRCEHKRSSYSAIEKFMFCERRFFYDRVCNLPEPPSTALAIGIWYHAVLETLVRTPTADLDEVIELGLQIAEADRSWTRPRMLDRLRGYMRLNLLALQKEKLFENLQPATAEEWVKSPRWIGKIDVLSAHTPYVDDDGNWAWKDESCALDWKIVTTTSRRTSRSVREDGQLALYCLASGRTNAAIIELHKRGPETAPPRLLSVSFTEEELGRWERWFDAVDKTIRTRNVHDEDAWKLARPSEPLCSSKWCPRWNICPGGDANEHNS